jgi:hypothetical protein
VRLFLKNLTQLFVFFVIKKLKVRLAEIILLLFRRRLGLDHCFAAGFLGGRVR